MSVTPDKWRKVSPLCPAPAPTARSLPIRRKALRSNAATPLRTGHHPGPPRLPMDLRKLKTLIDLVSESNISELEIAEADGKVRIVKAAGAIAAPVHAAPAVGHLIPGSPAAAPV